MKFRLFLLWLLCFAPCLLMAYPPELAAIGNLKLSSGREIRDCRIGYQMYGRLNSEKSNAILFPTWFTGTTEDIVRYVKPWTFIDTTRYCLILADALGNGISSSPTNSTSQHGADFPVITIKDMVNSQYALLTEHLHIRHLYAVFGISMGGFQAYQWAVSYPDFADRVIPIVGSPKLSSYDLLYCNALRMLIEDDPGYNHGRYKTNPAIPVVSMIFNMNLTTPIHIAETLPAEKVAETIDAFKKPATFDWNNFHTQLLAVIGQDISKDFNGSLANAAKHIKARMLLVNNKQDHTVNPLPAIGFAKLLPAKLLLADNELGHQGIDYTNPEFRQMVEDLLK